MTNNTTLFFAFLLAGGLAASAYGQSGQLGSSGCGSRDGWMFWATYFAEPALAPGQRISIQGHGEVIHEDAQNGRPTVFHRVFMDPVSKSYIGYDVEVEPSDRPGSARLRFKPLSLHADQLPKQYRAANYRLLPPPGFPAETFPSGQTIAVEVLKNPATGQKVVDYVEVSFEPVHLPSKAEPRDFQVADVILHIFAPSLLVNGAEVPAGVMATQGVARKLVWLSVPGRGRFLLSLAPYPGHPFQKAGVITAYGLSFAWSGDRYEWRSRSQITESSGNWNLYVLQASPDGSAPGFSFGAVNSVEEFLSRPQHLQ